MTYEQENEVTNEISNEATNIGARAPRTRRTRSHAHAGNRTHTRERKRTHPGRAHNGKLEYFSSFLTVEAKIVKSFPYIRRQESGSRFGQFLHILSHLR